MTERRAYSRHGLNAAMARVNLRGFTAIDRRTAGARAALAFRQELVTALGGEADLSPQRRRLIDMAVRAALLLDHVDAWLFEQRSLVNRRTRALLPVLSQRQALADHLARLLDRLGLDRVPQKVPDLTAYVAQRYAGAEAPDGSQSGISDSGEATTGQESRSLPRSCPQEPGGPA